MKYMINVKKTNHANLIRIAKAPKILIISLQRLDTINKIKNNILVEFNETLSIEKYVDTECEKRSAFNYDLYAVIYHGGDLNGGHYYAAIKLFGQENWFEYNDTVVRNLGKKVICNNGYILFYILRE